MRDGKLPKHRQSAPLVFRDLRRMVESQFEGSALTGIRELTPPLIGDAGNVIVVNPSGDGFEYAAAAGGLSDGDYGDITVSGSGTAMAIDAGAVTLAKQANVATGTVFYRKTAGAGSPEVQTLATLKTDLGLTGTNSGDQTSIVGITGSLAEFNAALTGADFATGGGTATGSNTGDQDLSGLLVKASNLSDLTNAATARTNLGLAIGVNVQAFDTQLSDLAALSYTGNANKVVRVNGAANAFELVTLAGGGDLLAANNLSDLASAATARTNLGGTTIGQALFTLTNPGAITFPRYNADNTVTARSATNLLTDLGLSANGKSLVTAADYATMKALLDLEIGTDVQAFDADLASIASLTTTAYGRALLELANQAALTALIATATTSLSGAMSAADKTKLDYDLTPVHMTADAAARGAAIADYFATTLSLEASSTYDIECHVHFLKTTAGTLTWTWTFSNAPTMVTSRSESTPVTGYTGATITGAPVQAQATAKAQATVAHAASGSLTTAVDHSFIFWVRIRTNAATTVQLRSTESAGTITPRAGSYMRARKIV